MADLRLELRSSDSKFSVHTSHWCLTLHNLKPLPTLFRGKCSDSKHSLNIHRYGPVKVTFVRRTSTLLNCLFLKNIYHLRRERSRILLCLLLLTSFFEKAQRRIFFFLAQKMGNTVFLFFSDSYHAICANQPMTNCRNDIPP